MTAAFEKKGNTLTEKLIKQTSNQVTEIKDNPHDW